MSNVAVIGGGAWGTALAAHDARQGCGTRIWAREPEPESIRHIHRFEPGMSISDLSWHPENGQQLLCAAGGDVVLIVPPELFWDPAEPDSPPDVH